MSTSLDQHSNLNSSHFRNLTPSVKLNLIDDLTIYLLLVLWRLSLKVIVSYLKMLHKLYWYRLVATRHKGRVQVKFFIFFMHLYLLLL